MIERIDLTYLPHKAEYLTLMIISVGSTIFGIGRSSILTSNFPLNTTAFIVVFDIFLFLAVAIELITRPSVAILNWKKSWQAHDT